jgi:hypothetical protein
MNTLFQSIPTTEGVRKVGPDQGERFDIAGAHLTWKVKGEDSGYAFSICEQTLAPGEGVPLHSHASAEAFYILSGAADFFRLVDGEEDWIRCETGGLMIFRRTHFTRSTTNHLNLAVSFVFLHSYTKLSSMQSLTPIAAQIAAQHNMYFAPVDVSKPVGQR